MVFDMEPVGSDHLTAVGYNPITGTLTIQFTDGQVYEYDDVPIIVHEQLMGAPSKGQYFAENIRLEYTYRKVE